MDQTIKCLGKVIRDAIRKISPPAGTERPSTKAIYRALKTAARPLLSKQVGDPVKCRYAGCPPVTRNRLGKKPRKVLEYLWDFSFSRFAIPEAIEQEGKLPSGKKYEILFLVESELGTADEICRDLLKLLDARAGIRCLVYKEPKRQQRRQTLHSRMIRVLHNHAHFRPREKWLFVGLSWAVNKIECDAYTLNNDGSGLRKLGI